MSRLRAFAHRRTSIDHLPPFLSPSLFTEVRAAAIDSVCELSVLRVDMATQALDFLVDMFNDEIDSVCCYVFFVLLACFFIVWLLIDCLFVCSLHFVHLYSCSFFLGMVA